MKKTKKLLALALALVMILALGATSYADYDYAANAKVFRTDFTGKTVILHSNDVHGALGGYAYMTELKNEFLAAGATDVILVDAGDFSQGTTYVSSSKGASAIAMMNAAGYDIVTLGNHEFDFGYAQLMENLQDADFEVICADVYLDETGDTILPATAVVEAETVDPDAEPVEGEEPATNLRIGFFGMETPETATKVNPGMIKEISFATFDDLYASAQLAVESLKEEEVDLIIGIVHLGVDAESAANGYRSIDLYENVTDIDFLIDGHSHTVMTAGENGEPIQSTGTKFENVGVLVIDDETKTISDNFLIATAGLEKDAEVQAAADEIMAAVDEEYGAVFAVSEVDLNGEKAPGNRTEETNMGELITDAMVWSVVSAGGLDAYYEAPVVGITNGGGIRAPIATGDVTKNDINTVLPFGNTVAVIYVTGTELLEALEASTYCTPEAVGGFPQTSGIEWTLDTTKEYDQGDIYTIDGKESSYYAPASIQRVTITAINGEPFDEAATYAVVTNNFCAAGGDTYNVFQRAYSEGFGFDTGIPMDEAVMDYVAEVLDGVIGDHYAAPSGLATQILAE
ncbi:MAG: 5'-nucleotidase C-terminal domain-containing protein [Oscillospiraceae bacterium]|nr:5'-nucleotidase C-terminal domain-containing protein [Oscillospiraceae bacterium]